MYCAKCGKELQNGVDFCPQCGEKQNNSLQETENQPTPSQKKSYKLLITIVCLIAVLPVVLICSAVINGEEESSGSSPYLSSPEHIQNTFESCHSTAEHIQAIYSYDLDNDNSLSDYELELFANAHPRLVNDKRFIEWVESMID